MVLSTLFISLFGFSAGRELEATQVAASSHPTAGVLEAMWLRLYGMLAHDPREKLRL